MKERAADSYRGRIQQLEREIRVNQSVIEDELKNVGEIVAEDPAGTAEDSAISEGLEECASFKKGIEDKRGRIERIKEIQARVQEIGKKIARNEQEEKSLVQQNSPHYEKIGHAAFEYYQENPFTDQEYADIFSELVQNQHDLNDLENSIRENETQTEGKPLFDRVVLRGKTALLKSRRQAKLNAFPRMFRAAGERISTTEFMSMTKDESIAEVAGPFLENVRKIDALRSAEDKLRQEESRLNDEMDGICESRKPARRVSDLENGLKEDHVQLALVYRRIGRRYRQLIGENGQQPPSHIEEYLHSIAETEKEIAARRQAIERLNAAIEIERLTRETVNMQTTIQSLEEQISRQQEEISRLNEKIADAEQQKRKLAKTRGAEDKLLEL